MDPVRLACVRHAASVRSEPGSNSQVNLPKIAPRRSTDLSSPLHITRLTRSGHRQPSPPRSLRTAQTNNNQIQDPRYGKSSKPTPKPAARESLLVFMNLSNSRAREPFRLYEPGLSPTEAGLYVTVPKPVNVLLTPIKPVSGAFPCNIRKCIEYQPFTGI